MSASAARAHQVPAIVPAKDGHGRTTYVCMYVCMYGHDRSSCVSMKNQLDALPFFLNYGAPLAEAPLIYKLGTT